jgi:hypothetical protein
MGKYSCEKCAKSFSQKSHYDKHISRKNPCEIQTDKIKALIDKAVDEKLIELNIKLNLNNTESNITINITEQMDILKMSKIELLEKCKELGITKCSSKNKPQLIELINSKNKTSNNTEEYKNMLIGEDGIIIQGKELKQAELVESKKDTPNDPNDTNFSLFEECLQKVSIKEVADKLNLCVGTIRRWIELKDVPIQYTFDLYKILSKEIDYSKYTYSLKDQFFTPKNLAKKCWEIFNREVKINTQEYTFIEPSAGDGSFLHILPNGSIGLDIEPRSTGIQKQDYLTWKPTNTSKKHIVFGNPPFGLRGHLALNFINHSYSFADYVCFILPQLFESDGKGSPRKRVNGYNLIYSEGLSAMFYSPDNKEVKVNGVFQIWSKNTSNQKYTIKPNSQENMKVYSLSDGGTIASTRNKAMIDKCDIYLPSTCFGKYNMKIYKKFKDLPGGKGYGVLFFTKKADMINKAETIDWASISFLSTNSAYNLRTSIILDQFI